jgi:CTD nuclear envelope phosphatase 1
LSSAGATESRRGSRSAILNEKDDATTENLDEDDGNDGLTSEETPLLEKESGGYVSSQSAGWNIIPRLSRSILDSIHWVLSTLAAPGVYLIACLYDERGNFAPFSQIGKLGSVFSRGPRRASTTQALGITSIDDSNPLGDHNTGKSATGRRGSSRTSRFLSSSSSSSGMSSESESDRDRYISQVDQSGSGTSGRHTRSKSLQNSDEIAPARRSIRIKLHNEDSVRQRKPRKSQSTTTQSNGSGAISGGEISPATLKSPTSPAASLMMTKYPRAPAPPRPLIPRRQPSYTLPDAPSGRLTQKTLILDLDETLIHSMAKGGRMSTGHMVEVKLNTFVGTGGAPSIGSQHPILYYVHKRPHCDDFLRRVSES